MNNIKYYFLILFIGLCLISYPQVPNISWASSLGGTNEDQSNSVIKTTDGGFLLVGSSLSSDGDVVGANGDSDCWIVKVGQNGDTLWTKTFGGTNTELGQAAIETSDGGYLIAASSNSNNGDVGGNKGGFDFWILKLNSAGLIQWSSNYGGSADDFAYDIEKAVGTGYIVTGSTKSNNGDVSGNHGSGTSDVWVIQIGLNGNLIQQKTFGGTKDEIAYSINKTSLGGYVVAGNAKSSNGDLHKNQGNTDLWIIKLSDEFDTAWTRTYGGSGDESAFSVSETGDLGFLVSGYTNSNDGDVQNNLGMDDFWALKLDRFGNTVWTKTLGGTNDDIAYASQQLIDSAAVAEYNQYFFDGVSEYVVLDPFAFAGVQEEMFVMVDATIVDKSSSVHLFKAGGDNNRGGMNVQFRNNGNIVRVTHNNAGPLKTISNINYDNALMEQEESIWGFSNKLNEKIAVYKNGQKIGEDYYPAYDSTCYDAGGSPINCSSPLVASVDNGLLGDPNRIYIASKNDISSFVNGGMGYFAFFNVVPSDAEIALMSKSLDSIPSKYNNASQDPIEFGSLVIGQQYRILDNSGNANFISAGAPDNAVGTVFIATGTSVYWGNGLLYAEGVTILLKYDKTNYVWSDEVGNSNGYVVSSPKILETYDQCDYFLAGKTNSNDGDVTVNQGNSDSWIVKMDELGTINWSNTFGGSNNDEARSILIKDDGYYVVAGKSSSNDGDVTDNQGGADFWTFNTQASSGCSQPLNLEANNITVSSAELSWTDQGNPVQWDLIYGLAGFDTTGVVPTVISEKPIMLTGLSPSTSYDWYIRGSCSNSNSQWVTSNFTTGTPAAPSTLFSMTFGGSGKDIAYSAIQTDDQNIIVAGYTQSSDGDVHGFKGGNDYWILKLDGNGDTIWTRTYGGSDDDRAYDVFQNFEGNYFVTGSARSRDGDVQGSHGSSEYWPIKLDDSGDTLWSKAYGGTYFERTYQAIQTIDSGYIFAGYTVDNSFPDTSLHRESRDYWILKTNKVGDSVWSKILGGTSYDIAYSVAETYDLGYVSAGMTRSKNMDVHDNNGNYDMWVARFNHVGDTLWTRCYGGTKRDEAHKIKETADSGFIMVGGSNSVNRYVHDNHGGYDFWVVKMDRFGDTAWTRSYGGSADEKAFDVIQTMDGNYLLAGYTESNDGDVEGNHGLSDYWIIKIDQAGELLWSKTLGGSKRDSAFSVRELGGGNILIAGSSESFDGDVPGNKGSSDFWIVKMSEFSSCAPPTNAIAHVVDAASYQLEWDITNAGSWQLLLGSTGFDTTGAEIYASTENHYLWDNLITNETYDWYLRSVCDAGEYSEWIGPLSFTTTWHTRKAPYLTYNGVNSEMLVNWQLLDSESCTLQWGTDDGYGSLVNTTEYGDDHQHKHNLSGLTPSTKYYYKMSVGNEEHVGNFISAPEETDSQLSFYVYGDHRSFPQRHDSVARKIIENMATDNANQTMIISTGDIVGNGSSEDQWDSFLFATGQPYIDTLLQKLPFQAAMGNHERPGELFKKYLPYDFAGADGNYYSYDYGAVHFTVIDQYSDYSVGSDQHTWLVNDLSNSNSLWKMIVLHAPGYSAGYYANDTNVQQIIQPLCETYNVQFVFAGHQHYYARAQVNGVTHITTGGGGSTLYDPPANAPYVDTAVMAYHFCKVNIDGNLAQIVAIDREGDTIDIWETEFIGCPAPTNLLATNITSQQAELSWTENGDAENWQLLIGTSGFDTTGIAPTLSGSNPYLLAGLLDNTSYDFYVRSYCAPGSQSNWTGPVTFITDEIASNPSLPFIETWENYNGQALSNSIIYDGGNYSWEFETDIQNLGRARWGNYTFMANNGSGALTMDVASPGQTAVNFAILTLDLSGYSNSDGLELSFFWVDHRNEERPNNKVWIRGSNTSEWIGIYYLSPETTYNNVYQYVSGIDIDFALASANPPQLVSETFQLRLGQEDNRPTADNGTSDGISYDDIEIIEIIPAAMNPLLGNGVENNEINDNINIYAANSFLYVKSLGSSELEHKSLKIYDLFGKLLIDKDLAPSALDKLNLGNIKGYLIVKVISGDQVYSSKVFVN